MRKLSRESNGSITDRPQELDDNLAEDETTQTLSAYRYDSSEDCGLHLNDKPVQRRVNKPRKARNKKVEKFQVSPKQDKFDLTVQNKVFKKALERQSYIDGLSIEERRLYFQMEESSERSRSLRKYQSPDSDDSIDKPPPKRNSSRKSKLGENPKCSYRDRDPDRLDKKPRLE